MIAQLLLAVFVMVMLGLVVMIGKTFHTNLTGNLLAYCIDPRRHKLRLWPSGASTATALIAAALGLWALGSFHTVALVSVVVVLTIIVVASAIGAARTLGSPFGALPSWTSLVTNRAISLSATSSSFDNRERYLQSGRFSVITASLEAIGRLMLKQGGSAYANQFVTA